MDNVKALGVGATFKEVSKKAISAYPIILPPLSLQQAFAEKVQAIERQKELINQSIKDVQTLFDAKMDYYFGE
jgi:type I restriction enzyme S subunit